MSLINYNLLSTALSQYNIAEIKGSKHNSEILKYFRAAGFPNIQSDEVAWCAAFANWVLYENGFERSGKLTARSLLKVGTKVKDPEPGDLVIFWRSSPSSWKGHVGFYVKQTKNYIYCLGGNQGNRVSIARYRKDRLLGYRRIEPANRGVDFCGCKIQPVREDFITRNRLALGGKEISTELIFLGDTGYLDKSIEEAFCRKVEITLSDLMKLDFCVDQIRVYKTADTLENALEKSHKKLHEKYNNNSKNICIFVLTSGSNLEGFSSPSLNSVFVDIDSSSKYSSTIAHQVGHMFGLNHVSIMSDQEKSKFGISGDLDKFNLMNSNIYGKLLTDYQIGYVHNVAIEKFFN